MLKSALSSSGIFFKTIDCKYYFKQKEAFDYVVKVAEKDITKKLENFKKEVKPSKISKTKSSKKK